MIFLSDIFKHKYKNSIDIPYYKELQELFFMKSWRQIKKEKKKEKFKKV